MNFLVTALMLVTIAGSTVAAESDPAQMAAEVGFAGCDVFIRKTFEHALVSPDRRINISYFSETKVDSVTLTATFGPPGDTVFQAVTFTKKGPTCYSIMTAQTSKSGNCAEILLKEDKNFSLVDTQGDVLWARSDRGVRKFYRQVGAFCLVNFRLDKTSKDKS